MSLLEAFGQECIDEVYVSDNFVKKFEFKRDAIIPNIAGVAKATSSDKKITQRPTSIKPRANDRSKLAREFFVTPVKVLQKTPSPSASSSKSSEISDVQKQTKKERFSPLKFKMSYQRAYLYNRQEGEKRKIVKQLQDDQKAREEAGKTAKEELLLFNSTGRVRRMIENRLKADKKAQKELLLTNNKCPCCTMKKQKYVRKNKPPTVLVLSPPEYIIVINNIDDDNVNENDFLGSLGLIARINDHPYSKTQDVDEEKAAEVKRIEDNPDRSRLCKNISEAKLNSDCEHRRVGKG